MNLNIEVNRSMLILNCESSEAKRNFYIVQKIISKQNEHAYIKELKYRNKANTFDSLNIYFETKRTCL